MSTRSNLRPQIVIPSAQGSPANGSSMAANITSAPTVLQSLSKVSYSLSWSGTAPVGTASVQVSNDYAIGPNGLVINPGTWTTLELDVAGTPSMTVPITGATGTAFIDILETVAYAIRLQYTAASGTGTLQAIINGKVS